MAFSSPLTIPITLALATRQAPFDYPIDSGEPKPVAGLTEPDRVIGGSTDSDVVYVLPDTSAIPE